MDIAWWNQYGDEARRDFKGKMVSPLRNVQGVRYLKFPYFQNSGAGAISLANHLGAKNIILLGYDGQKTNGKAHWHADHPRGMGNAGPVDKWVKQFRRVEREVKSNIINCSRETALEFKRLDLDEVIHGLRNS